MRKRTRLLKEKLLALLLVFVMALPLFAVVGISTTAKPVSAETVATVSESDVVPGEDNDELFDFAQGASLRKDLKGVSFVLYEKKSTYAGQMNWTGEFSLLKFTLYHYDGGLGYATPKYEIMIYSVRKTVKLKMRTHVYILAKEIEHDAEVDISSLEIYPKQLVDEDITYESDYKDAKVCEDTVLKYAGYKNYKVLQEGTRWTDVQGASEPHCDPFEFDDSESIPSMRIAFSVSGITSSYFVKASYAVALKSNLGIKVVASGGLTSPYRSMHGILCAIRNSGNLEKEFGTGESLQLAQELLAQGDAGNKITLHYLEDIDGTYFSEKKSAQIQVPIVNGRISIDDVKVALSKESLKVQNSYVDTFISNADGTEWTTTYLSSVWLRTKTVDGNGHYINMFLDLNKSYGDYFTTIIDKIDNGRGLYEYMWNGFQEMFPVLEGKNPEDVHGFFGLVWIPKRNTLSSFSSAMSQLFNVKSEEFGFIKYFKSEQAITLKEHKGLMAAYNYNWISTAWDETLDLASGKQTTAEYYFFAAKPMEYTGISQTGNTDPEDDDGAGGEVIEDIGGELGGIIGGLINDMQDTEKMVKRLASLLVLAAIVVACMWGYGQVKGNGKRK